MSNSPAGRSGTASPSTGAAGYLLLTISHAVVKQVYDEDVMTLARGELRLECVSLPIPPEIGHQTANPFSPSPSDPPVPTHDFWLVLKIGPTFEVPIIPDEELRLQSGQDGITYSLPSSNVPNASLLITLPPPQTLGDMEDLESFEVLLRQYRSLGAEVTALSGIAPPTQQPTSSPPLAPGELRGRIVLINEDNGEVVGELDQTLDIDEDRKVAGDDKHRPVMLDFGQVINGEAGSAIKVKTIPAEELDDWMLKGAHTISRGILSFGSWSSRQMMTGADKFIRNTTPRAEPVKLSDTTKANISRVHGATAKTATVTKSTLGKVHNAISTVAEKGYTHGYQPAVNAYRQSTGTGHPRIASSTQAAPPIPPKPAHLLAGQGYDSPAVTSPPPLPHSSASPREANARPPVLAIPSQTDTLLAEEEKLVSPPAYNDRRTPEPIIIDSPSLYSPASSRAQTPSSSQAKKRPLLGRLLLAGEVVFTSLEATAHDLINTGTIAASSAAGHKYGQEAGDATALLGGSVKNVAVVYIDVAGVGRRALLKSTAKGVVRARLKDGETVTLQAEGHDFGISAGEVEREGGQIVVGMSEVGKSSAVDPRYGNGSDVVKR